MSKLSSLYQKINGQKFGNYKLIKLNGVKMKKVSSIKNISLSVLLSISVLGITACKDNNSPSVQSDKIVTDQAQGPSESGGGDPNKIIMNGMYDLIEEQILRTHIYARSYVQTYKEAWSTMYVFKDHIKESPLWSQMNENPQLSELINVDTLINTGVFLHGGQKLFDALAKLETPLILRDEPCIDKNTNEEKAASATYEGRICFSLKKLSELTEFNQIEATVRSMLMHELAHKAGITDEKQAQSIEALMWLFGKQIGFDTVYFGHLQSKLLDSPVWEVNRALNTFEDGISNYEDDKEWLEKNINEDRFFVAMQAREDSSIAFDELKELWRSAWMDSYADEEAFLNFDLEKLLSAFTQKDYTPIQKLYSLRDVPRPIIKFYQLKSESYQRHLDQLQALESRGPMKLARKFADTLSEEYDFDLLVQEDEFKYEFSDTNRDLLMAISDFSNGISRATSYFPLENFGNSENKKFLIGDRLNICGLILNEEPNSETLAKLVRDFCEQNDFQRGMPYSEQAYLEMLPKASQYLTNIVKKESPRIMNELTNIQIYQCAFLNEDDCSYPDNPEYNYTEDSKLKIQQYKKLKSLKRAPSLGMVHFKYKDDLAKALEDYEKLPENLPTTEQVK